MTNVLVALEVYWGYGGKNDITVNRIVSNATGIAMAMFMAIFPMLPGIYGGSPHAAMFILDDSKKIFQDCMELTIKGSDPNEIKSRLQTLHEHARIRFISQFDFAMKSFTDASQFSRLCVLRLDPRMLKELDDLAVLCSSITALIHLATILVDHDSWQKHFAHGTDNRKELEQILSNLQIDQKIPKNIADHSKHSKHTKSENSMDGNIDVTHVKNVKHHNHLIPASKTYVSYCKFIHQYLLHREANLREIKWGFFGNQTIEGGEEMVYFVKLYSSWGGLNASQM